MPRPIRGYEQLEEIIFTDCTVRRRSSVPPAPVVALLAVVPAVPLAVPVMAEPLVAPVVLVVVPAVAPVVVPPAVLAVVPVLL